MIRYYSTNKKAAKLTFKEALLKGLAPDKGLFMLDGIPAISNEGIDSLKKKSYAETAFDILSKFLKDEIPDKELKKLTKDAYNFEVPIEKVNEQGYIARLDRGPTASFKDFAANSEK